MRRAQPSRTFERGRVPISGAQITFAVILAVGMILAIRLSTRMAEGRPLQEATLRVQQEVVALEAQQATLIAQRDFSQSDAYVEQWARSEGKMVRPGEVLVVPRPSLLTLPPTPFPVPSIPVETVPRQPEPWQLWWALFFDVAPPDVTLP